MGRIKLVQKIRLKHGLKNKFKILFKSKFDKSVKLESSPTRSY